MTEWSDFVFYHCRFSRCNEPCINEIDSRYTLTKSCRECYTDNLHDPDPDSQADEGFVDWYRLDEHDHSEQWVRDRTNAHDLIEFGDETQEEETTAGAYLGKYPSATFGSLLDATDSFEQGKDEHETYGDKAATWKLGLYWATNRRFSSCLQTISDGIDPNEHLQDPDVRESVRWCSLGSVKATCETTIRDRLACRKWNNLDNFDAAIKRTISDVEQLGVRLTLPEESPFRCVIDYIGAYTYWDLPFGEFNPPQQAATIEGDVSEDNELPVVDRENNPPATSVWN